MLIYFLLNFFLFNVLGWILENIYSLFSYGHFQKDGFLSLPFKPMYGITMSTLILLHETIATNNYIFIPLCLLVPTSIEYITGKIMRTYFNKDYWNYSKCRFNVNGLICAKFSIYWTFLSYISVIYVYPIISDKLYVFLYPYSILITTLLSLILLIDIIITLKHFSLGTN